MHSITLLHYDEVPQQLARGCPHSCSCVHGHSVPESAAALEGRSDSETEVDLKEKREEGPLRDAGAEQAFLLHTREWGGRAMFADLDMGAEP